LASITNKSCVQWFQRSEAIRAEGIRTEFFSDTDELETLAGRLLFSALFDGAGGADQ